MNNLQGLKQWVKAGNHPLAHMLKTCHYHLHNAEVPAIGLIFQPLRICHNTLNSLLSTLTRVFYWTPMFKTRLIGSKRNLYLYGGMPLVQGSLSITLGDRCRISGQTTFSGRWSGKTTPELLIGDNVGIAWQTTIAVGTKVILEDNVRIAGRCYLLGYPGHPIDPEARAKGLPDTDDQIGPIHLKRDVWLGSGVTVMKGVTIGKGTIVAAGSVVTQDLPPGVLAAGVPAKAIKKLNHQVKARTYEEILKEKTS